MTVIRKFIRNKVVYVSVKCYTISERSDYMTDTRYYSSKEAAELLGLSTRRVVGLCNDGKLDGAFQKGRGWKIPETAVKMYLKTVQGQSTNEKVLTCAVGNTSYMDVVKNSYYVDKTLLIRDLIDDQVPVILFTRPRRFGKTLAMDMLKTFFEKSKEDTSVYFNDKKSGNPEVLPKS